jgi:hypothetical protein
VRRKAVLPNVERMLIAAAKQRVAESKRRRRGGPGFAVIVFAAMALAGGALAATGVWSPLGGDSDQAQHSHPTPSGEPAETGPGFTRGVPGVPRESRSGRLQAAAGPVDPVTAAPQPVQPTIEYTDGGIDQAPAPNGEGPHGPSGIGGAQPEDGVSPEGNGTRPEPGKPQDGDGPRTAPPAGPNDLPSPRPTRISVSCEGLRETQPATSCQATVVGEAGSPTGQVSFETPGPNQFSPASCTLAALGDGISSACSVDFFRLSELPVTEAAARYSGDSLNAPSSTNFSIPFP